MNTFFGFGDKSSYDEVPQERAPLGPGDIGKIVGAKANEIKDNVGAKANEIKDNTVKISGTITEINRENPGSYRIWKIISGLLMMASSLLNFVMSSVGFEPREIVLALYSFFFGFLICLMEARVFFLPESWKDRMYRLFNMLSYTWGKGAYFLSVGVFSVSQGEYRLDYVAGVFTILVGILCLSTSYGANKKLRELHEIISNRASLKMALTHSFSSNGYVSRMNLRHFFATNGISLSSHELEAVFDFFDSDKNDFVSVEDFCLWYDALAQTIASDDIPLLV